MVGFNSFICSFCDHFTNLAGHRHGSPEANIKFAQKYFLMRKVGELIREERVKFKKGLQRKFIEQIKKKSGLTWIALAKELNLSEHTIRIDWRKERTTIPLSYAKRLLAKHPFESWVVIRKKWVEKTLAKNWGQELGGGKNKKNIKVPEKSEKLAELFGVILGDGHIDSKTLTITGNFYEIEHYKYLQNMIKQLFGLSSKIFRLKNSNAMQLKVNSTELVKFLLKNSLVLGDKIKNKVSLPRWIFEKDVYIYGALRGLLDTDGGIYQKQKKYKRLIIEFQTDSPQIRSNLYQMLWQIGFAPSKSDVNVRIQRQEEVHRFLTLVGCANPKNIMRYKYFIETGEIPLKECIWSEITGLQVEEPFKAALVYWYDSTFPRWMNGFNSRKPHNGTKRS